MDSNTTITKQTKNKIRVDYEGKLSFKERFQAKLKASNTWIKAGVTVVRFILMLGVSYVILYPFFARIAEDEGYKDVATAFKQISQVEDCHYKMLTELYNLLRTGKAYKSPEEKKWKCIKCGYEAMGKESWDICPLCGLDKGSVLIEIGGEEE